MPEPVVLNLDRYFARIGYSGRGAATLETLAVLHALHPAAIPFENLDPLLGRPVPLDLDALQDKLVTGGRGGYCYEHNLLFAAVLRRLGFRVRGLAARVVWSAPADLVRPRTHMLLRVEIDGRPYLADVGFGGLTLTAPLRLELDAAQPTPHERFRLVAGAGDVIMQAELTGAWVPLYRFGDEEHVAADYDVANWYVSTHPQSLFRTSLMVARAQPGMRHALLNGTLTTYDTGAEPVRRTLRSAVEVRQALEQLFGIAVPETGALDGALQRLLEAGHAPAGAAAGTVQAGE